MTEKTIWELVAEAAETLPEPFSRAALVSWISKRRPDVDTSLIATHIQYAVAEAPNRRAHPLGARAPVLQRVGHGLYRRMQRDAESAAPPATAVDEARSSSGAASWRSTGRVLLVGCSRTKADAPAEARDLFKGNGFGLARTYAEKSGQPWFILSAKYGLLDPDDVVGPYDVYLAHQPATYRAAWGEWVMAQLSSRLALAGATVEIHASDVYSAPLREPLRRMGSALKTPLAGLRQGERLAWPGYRSGDTSADSPLPEQPVSLGLLLEAAHGRRPADFLAAGPTGLQSPGLYTWWVDGAGASQLSAGMGAEIQPGLLYAGKAGGDRPGSPASTSTLWGRIAGNHLRGNIRSSTLRKSLTALLRSAEIAASESELTAWMHTHLRVSALPVPPAEVRELEAELIRCTDPPLNLGGVERNSDRSALIDLRRLVRPPTREKSSLEGGDLSAGTSGDTETVDCCGRTTWPTR